MKTKITILVVIILLALGITFIFIQNKNKSITVITAGNAMVTNKVLADSYNINEKNYNFSNMLKYAKEYIKDYDIKFYSQVSPIKSSKYKYSGDICPNTPSTFATEMIHSGFNLINLATNHTLEGELELNQDTNTYYCKYYDGIVEESVNFWKMYNDIYTSGSYNSKEDRDKIEIKEVNGIKYALLSYTTNVEEKELTNKNSYYVNIYSKEQIKNDTESLKNKVDVILVSINWDNYDSNIPDSFQKQEAEYISSLGVNAIIGHGTKVIQPIERINNTLVIYSLGDLIPNYQNKNTNDGVGQLVSFKIKKEDKKIKITDITSELIYHYYDSNYSNNLIIPFSEMNYNYNEEYLNLYNKYSKIVKLYDSSIIVNKPNEKQETQKKDRFKNSSDREFILQTKLNIRNNCNNEFKSLLTSIETIMSGYKINKNIAETDYKECSIDVCKIFNDNYINCEQKDNITENDIINTIKTHKQIIVNIEENETSCFKENQYLSVLDYNPQKGIYVNNPYNNEECNGWIDIKLIKDNILKSYITF